MGIEIVKTSSYLPSNIVENSYFEATLDTSDEWIRSRTGIERRHFVEEETMLDLVEKAVGELEIDEVEAGKIKKVIVATCTSTSTVPSISSQIQNMLNLSEDIYAIDINMACSGYVAGLSLLNEILKEGEYGILVGVELFSKIMDFKDRDTCILFGDGVGASLVKYSEDEARFKSGIISNLDSLNYRHKTDYLFMEGKEVYRFAISRVSREIKKFIEDNDIDVDEVDYFFFHQANKRILNSMIKYLALDKDKVPSNLADVGNISAASIPVLLDSLNKNQAIKKGDNIVLIGFGAGLSWSIGKMKW